MKENPLIEHIANKNDIISAILGNGLYQIENVEKIITGSRNLLQRLHLTRQNGPSKDLVIKWYFPNLDKYFEHRFRREEKLLSLFDKWFPNKTPQVYGGLIVPGKYAVLLEEDLGNNLLSNLLSEKTNRKQKIELLNKVLYLLHELSEVTNSHYTAFYRVCYSIELDRLTLQTYNRKLRISLNRILNLYYFFKQQNLYSETGVPLLHRIGFKRQWKEIRDVYNSVVVKPISYYPKQIIHNSFAPTHLLLHQNTLKLIDFETMTIGAIQVDLAEFLSHATITLDQSDVVECLNEYMDIANIIDKENFYYVYWCACISRSLDYAGTLARRCQKHIIEGDIENAQTAFHGCLGYLDEVQKSFLKISDTCSIDLFISLVRNIRNELSRVCPQYLALLKIYGKE